MTLFKPDPEARIASWLRTLYSPPADPGYWQTLESRILARIAEAEVGWWTELDRWGRPALIAAAVLILAAGVTMYRARLADSGGVYRELAAPADPAASDIAPMGPREETLRALVDRL